MSPRTWCSTPSPRRRVPRGRPRWTSCQPRNGRSVSAMSPRVFIDPYTGGCLGQRHELDGLVGWANQLHRMFRQRRPDPRPALAGTSDRAVGLPRCLGPGRYRQPAHRDGGGMVLVLAASGVYLWWPRATERGKPRLGIRWRKGGRIRWRDLHATTGILLSVVLIRLHRLGPPGRGTGRELARGGLHPHTRHRIDARRHGGHGGRLRPTGPAHRLGGQGRPPRLGSLRHPTVELRRHRPDREVGEHDSRLLDRPAVGHHRGRPDHLRQLHRHQPLAAEALRTTNLYLDQFSGQTIANATADQDGALSRFPVGAWMCMGTQYGVLTRVLATGLCLGLLTSSPPPRRCGGNAAPPECRPARPDECGAKSHTPRGARRRDRRHRDRAGRDLPSFRSVTAGRADRRGAPDIAPETAGERPACAGIDVTATTGRQPELHLFAVYLRAGL